jgi:hypothetical protein
LTFILDKSVVTNEATDRQIPVAANIGSAATTNHGWNLIGQPFLSKFVASNALGDDDYFVYVYNTLTGNYTPFTSGGAPDMNPMSAYFVQASAALATSTSNGGLGINFSKAGRKASAVRSLVAVSLSNNVQINFTSTTGTDFTNLVMDNDRTTAYEIGKDLEKWIGTGTAQPQVFTMLGGINYAYNALPMSSVVNLPIGIYTLNAGTTTINANATQAPSLSKLLLTDNGVSPAVVTDLLTSNYSFTAAAGTNNTRFQITAQLITTDNNKISSELGEIGISIVNGALVLANVTSTTTVRVFDALGRMVIGKNSTSNMMEIKLNARGIYTVQLQSGTSILTRKVIL